MPGADKGRDVSRELFNRNLEMANLGEVTQEPPQVWPFHPVRVTAAPVRKSDPDHLADPERATPV
jgi:hypothetical protein